MEFMRKIAHLLAAYMTIMLGCAMILAPFMDWSNARPVWWGVRAGSLFLVTVFCAFMQFEASMNRRKP